DRTHRCPDPAVWQRRRHLQPTPCGDLDDRPTDQILIEQEPREDADPVATHLRDRSISVAVVHEQKRTIAIPAVDMLGEYRPKQAVSANTGAPVADEANLCGSDLEHRLPIEDDHKVVLSAVSFRERPPAHGVSLPFLRRALFR